MYQRNFGISLFVRHGILGSSIMLAICAVSGCKQETATQAQGARSVAVKTQIAQLIPIPDTSDYQATVKSRNSAAINAQVEGWITKISVHSGDQVREGAALMQVDPRVQQAGVNSQEAARTAQAATAANAKAQYDRGQQLFDSGIISKQDFDTFKTTYDSAEAQLKAMDAQVNQQQAQLHYYNVTAPSSGIIGDIPVHVGDRVTNTTLLTTVDQPGNLELYISVPVEHSKDLHQGESVDLLDDSGKVIGHSSIFFVSPQVDNSTQTVLAKAQIPNKGDTLRTAEFVNARVTWRINQGLVVPVLAVTRISGQFFTFITEKGPNGPVARQVQIQVGGIVGNNYILLGGIKPGDHIIVDGFQFVADGTPLNETVQNSPSEAASN